MSHKKVFVHVIVNHSFNCRYPLLTWSLNSDHSVQIEHFPPHYVSRTREWAWVIENENVHLISTDAAHCPPPLQRQSSPLAYQLAMVMQHLQWQLQHGAEDDNE